MHIGEEGVTKSPALVILKAVYLCLAACLILQARLAKHHAPHSSDQRRHVRRAVNADVEMAVRAQPASNERGKVGGTDPIRRVLTLAFRSRASSIRFK